MRRFFTSALLAAIALTSVVPAAAQRTNNPAVKMFSSESQFAFIRPITDGEGVLIRWQMKFESGVAGFNLYRIEEGATSKVNPFLVQAMSPEPVETGTLPEGHQYFDLNGRQGSGYVIETVQYDGGKVFSGAVEAEAVKSIESVVGIPSATFRQAAEEVADPIESRTTEISGELADVVATYAQTPDPVKQFEVASKQGAKIEVKQDGFYRVSTSELQAANFPVGSDPSKWRLFQNGVEQAIVVASDGSYIEFYGRGIDLPETNSRIYYLIADSVAGKRIRSKVVRTTPGTPTARSFPALFEKRERTVYSETLNNYDEENFVGEPFDSNGRLLRFNLSEIDFSAPTASITITLFGNGRTTHHRVTSIINGHELPLMTQFGEVNYRETFTFPTEHLVEGENVLELFSGPQDFNNFNKFELTYKREFTAESGKLSFSTPGYRKIDIGGFDTSRVRVFDTTFEGNPVLLNVPVEDTGSGFRVRVPGTRMMTGYAVEDTGLLQAPSITENKPSSYSLATNAADMLIISYSDAAFLNAAETWAAYRRSTAGGSLNTKVVSIDDVYDEFNFGIRGPAAIKNFLEHVSESWATAPKYALLIGEASTDPRRYLAVSRPDFVPTQVVRLTNETASDEALGDFDDDHASAIAIGRVPAGTAAEVTVAFNKMLAFETNQANFSRGTTFVHDSNAALGSEASTQSLIQRLPQGVPFDLISRTDQNAQAAIISRFNQGRSVVNYFGHGASGIWAGSDFFTLESVNGLTNRENPAFVSMFSCLNGYFAQHDRVSLAEYLLFKQEGGAAAVWASTGTTTTDVQRLLAEKFFDGLAGTSLTRVGDMIRVAKEQTPSGRDQKLSWALLGDPAMKMP